MQKIRFVYRSFLTRKTVSVKARPLTPNGPEPDKLAVKLKPSSYSFASRGYNPNDNFYDLDLSGKNVTTGITQMTFTYQVVPNDVKYYGLVDAPDKDSARWTVRDRQLLIENGKVYNNYHAWQNCFYRNQDIKRIAFKNAQAGQDLSGLFYNIPNLVTFDGENLHVTKQTQNMSSMFYGDDKLENLVHVSSWDTSHVTDIASIFDGCRKLSAKSWHIIDDMWAFDNIPSHSFAIYGTPIGHKTVQKYHLKITADPSKLLFKHGRKHFYVLS